MELVKNLGLMGVGVVIGLGAGYFLFNENVPEAEIEIVEPNLLNCRDVYNENLAQLEDKYNHIPSGSSATPNDIGIDYIISEEANFRGLVVTDKETGEQLAISCKNSFGNREIGLGRYKEITFLLGSAYDGSSIKPGLVDYQCLQDSSKLEDVVDNGKKN
ncbi:MAG: hypothetical protein ABIG93_05300 [archaeon]|nr:hypothetical protein [Nanoarchaeota archaeon]